MKDAHIASGSFRRYFSQPKGGIAASKVRGSRLLRQMLAPVPSGLAAALLVLLVASGCGDDDQSEPAVPTPAGEPAVPEEPAAELTGPTEEPTADPEESAEEPTADAEESAEEPTAEPEKLEEPVDLPVDGLAVTGETAVGDLLYQLPGEDRDCVRADFGDSEYEAITATTLAGLFADVAAAERLLNCFEVENSRGLALIEAQEGGLAPGTRGCLVALSFNHPELFALRIGVHMDALEVDHLEIHQLFLDILDCMNPLEQLVSMTRIRMGLEIADPLKLRDLESAFTEDMASCMSRAIDDWEAVLDAPPVTATPRPDVTAAMAECVDTSELAGFQARFFAATILALASDGGSQESLDCLVGFAVEYPDRVATFGAVPMQEFATSRDLTVLEANLDLYAPAVQDGILMLECLSDDELRRFQQRIPPALQAFQTHYDSQE